jgi:hypothetical protein
VFPIFESSCSLTSVCHGELNDAVAENLYLGPNLSDEPGGPTANDLATTHDHIVGVKSVEDPTMNQVTPGDLQNSYLWRKVDGDPNVDPSVKSACVAAASGPNPCPACTTSTPCGDQMPYLGEPLTPAQLCVISDWIVQGALNN